MGIDGDDAAEPVPLRDRRESYRRFALEASDFEDDAVGRTARGDERQEAGLTFREEARRGTDPRPRLLDRFGKIPQQY